MKSLRILLVIVLLQIAHAQDPGGDVEEGKQLFYDFALVGDASGITSSEQVFLTYLRLRADQNPINPKNAMPNYAASTLSDEQALDIYAYIKSVKDDSPEVEDNPVMRQILDAAKAGGPGNEN
jgi:hypothetical protein